jgi:peptide subunit release factor 1 (eRF1)
VRLTTLSLALSAGENGFNQAIELAADSLSNVKFVQEKRLIQKFFDEIALDTGKFVFGIDDTLKGLEMGAVETLIVWENLDVTRYVLRNAAGGASRFLPQFLGSPSRAFADFETIFLSRSCRGDRYPR